MDLVTANIGEPNGIFFGDGLGNFPRSQTFGRVDDASFAVTLSDLDRNGSLDIVVANNRQQNRIYFNEELLELSFGDAANMSYGVTAGDVNGDSYPDVVIANSGARNVVYFNVPLEP